MMRRGTVLGGRYALIEPIGGGAMGDVWRAEDTVLSRPVAVKVLRHELMSDSAFVQRFRREAKALAALDAPGIVRIHDYGESSQERSEERRPTARRDEEDRARGKDCAGGEHRAGGEDSSSRGRMAYIVMEHIEGRSLEDVRLEEGPMPPERALELIAQVLDALHVAHLRKVVHRDIKPSNLMLRKDGRVAVTDFGIARMPAGTKLTGAHSVLGTALYMAPEQAEGLGAIPASDLYSAGVVCYQLLTGELPFTGDSAVEVLLKHIREPAPDLPASVPEPVRAFVTRALAKRPEDRFVNGAAMAAAARAAARGETAKPPVSAAGTGDDEPGSGKEGQKKAGEGEKRGKGEKRKQEKTENETAPARRRPALAFFGMVLVVTVGTPVLLWLAPPDGKPEASESGGRPSVTGPSNTPESAGASEPAGSGREDGTRGDGPADGRDGEKPDGAGAAAAGAVAAGREAPDGRSGGGGESVGDARGSTDGSDGSDGSGGPGGSPDGGAGSGSGAPDGGADTGRPSDCGGAGWGSVVNAGDGQKLGLAEDSLEPGTGMTMGGVTRYGWVRISKAHDTFQPCNTEGHMLARTSSGGVVLSYGTLNGSPYWSVESASSGMYRIKGGLDCLTSHGAGRRPTLTDCASGNSAQLWRIPG